MARILVVEDDRDLRSLLAEELAGCGSLLFAESGADAIALITSMRELAAVVSDLELGHGPGGFDVLRAARARRPSCVRVLVTARHDVSLDREASELVEAICGKPWIVGTIRLYLKTRLG